MPNETEQADGLSAIEELLGAADAVDEPEPEAVEENFASSEEDVVDSEQAPEAEAEDNSSNEPAQAVTSDADSEAIAETDAQPARTYVDGKYNSVEDLETGYRSASKQATQQAQMLGQMKQQNALLQAQLLQAQQSAVPSRPPALEDLSAEAQQWYTQQAQRMGVPETQLIYQDWAIERGKAQERAEHAKAQQQHILAAQEQACDRLQAYVVETYKSDSILQDMVKESPEFFHVLDQMQPAAIEKFGKHLVDLRAENQRLKAQLEAGQKAVRTQMRQESKDIKTSKQAAKSEASRAGAAPAVGAPPSSSKQNPTEQFCKSLGI